MFLVVVFGVMMFVGFCAFVVGTLSLGHFHNANSEYHADNLAVIAAALKGAADERPEIVGLTNGLLQSGLPKLPNLDTSRSQYAHLRLREMDFYNYDLGEFQSQTSAGASTGVFGTRVAAWMPSPLVPVNSVYLDENPCAKAADAGAGLASSHWCGQAGSLWTKIETSDSILRQYETEQHRLYRLARKLTRLYAKERTFTALGPVGTSEPLIRYTHHVGVTYSTCTDSSIRTTSAVPVPLDCRDLFNAWGKPLYLHIVAPNHAVITNVLGVNHRGADGLIKPVRLAEELYIETK